jgi:hypothetical protein
MALNGPGMVSGPQILSRVTLVLKTFFCIEKFIDQNWKIPISKLLSGIQNNPE